MTELFAGRQATGWCWQKAVAVARELLAVLAAQEATGGAASWAVFLGSFDLALAARAVRRHRGRGRSGGLALVGGTGVAGARALRRRRMARSARRA